MIDVDLHFTEIAPRDGTPGLDTRQVAPQVDVLFMPGRFRSKDGMDLDPRSAARVIYAATIFKTFGLAERSGLVIASGYRNPEDQTAEIWTAPDGAQYIGKPEAYSMKDGLIEHGVPEGSILVEPESYDSVTNLTRSRAYIPEGATVGIVAQEKHLDRFLDIIVPKVLGDRNPYIGFVVPELDPQDPDEDGLLGRMFSRAALLGVTPETPSEKVESRVISLWNGILRLKRMERLPKNGAAGEAQRLRLAA